MVIVEGRTLDAGRRVQGFLDKNGVAIGALVPPTMRAKLDGAVAKLQGFQQEQDLMTSAAKGETAAQAALRDEIYRTLVIPVATNAARVLRGSPDLPTLSVTAADARTAAFGVKVSNLADTAAKYESTLMGEGLPPDFLAQLRDGVARLTASDRARDDQRQRRSTATAGIKSTGQAVRDQIKVIDGRLSLLRKQDPSFEAGWQASKRIHQTAVNPLPTGGVVVDDSTTNGATETPAADPAPDTAPPTPPVNPPVNPPADGTKPSA
jgi:hypothetical protein